MQVPLRTPVNSETGWRAVPVLVPGMALSCRGFGGVICLPCWDHRASPRSRLLIGLREGAILSVSEGPPRRSVQRNEPYILPQTSNFPLAGAVRLRQSHPYGCRERRRARHGTAGAPGARPGVGRAPAPDRGGLVPADGDILVGKASPPFAQINQGKAKRGRVKFGPGGFQSSGLLLLSHFIIMNNKEILTHGFCKLFIACTEKSGQQYVKQTTCMSALIQISRLQPCEVLLGPLIRGEEQGLGFEATGRRSSCHHWARATAAAWLQLAGTGCTSRGDLGSARGPPRTRVARSAFNGSHLRLRAAPAGACRDTRNTGRYAYARKGKDSTTVPCP